MSLYESLRLSPSTYAKAEFHAIISFYNNGFLTLALRSPYGGWQINHQHFPSGADRAGRKIDNNFCSIDTRKGEIEDEII